MQRASSIASSSASLVPDPTEKCAVCAASPIRTTGTLPRQCTQLLHTTRGNRIHCAEPRRCAALDIRRCPSRWRAKRRSHHAIDSSFSMRSRPGRLPYVLRRFDDERRRRVVEAVRVRLEPAVLGLLECERERLEELVRAEPDEAAAAQVDVGLVRLRVPVADAAPEPIARDDEVGIRVRLVALHVRLEHELDAERFAPRLQDVEKALAADPAKAVAARADRAAADVDLDVVPVIERGEDRLGGRRVGLAQVAERLVGEHDAPPERVVRPVALDHGDAMARVALFHQQREVEARPDRRRCRRCSRRSDRSGVNSLVLK